MTDPLDDLVFAIQAQRPPKLVREERGVTLYLHRVEGYPTYCALRNKLEAMTPLRRFLSYRMEHKLGLARLRVHQAILAAILELPPYA